MIIEELKDTNAELSDDTINYILNIVRNNTDYKPQSTLIYYVNVVDIEARHSNERDVQVLYGGSYQRTGHWIATYYTPEKQQIFIIDSFYRQYLDDNQRQVLSKLYPFIENLDKHIVYWKPQFRQKDSVSCGVFALSYLLSIAQDEHPEFLIESVFHAPKKISYRQVMFVLRRYLKQIVKGNKLFPFDLKNYVARSMLHLFE